MNWTIYHNPRCSKSRETLALLEQKGIEATVVEYLKTPMTLAKLKTLKNELGCTAWEMLRTKEADFEHAGLDKTKASDTQVFKAIMAFPKLLERPIVSNGQQAVFGRPPENVLALL